MYYSVFKKGFFPSSKRGDYDAAGTWPADAKLISDETEAILRDALAKGDAITEDANGFVITPRPPEPLADVKKRLADAVDDAIARVYAKYTRFAEEYKLREAEAQAFVAAGYVGTVGELVAGYAVTQPNMTDQQAIDAILSQANALRGALTVLGNLRMRKNEIKSDAVVDATAAQAIHDDIIAKADLAVAGL